MAQCQSRRSPAALRRRVSPGLPLSRTPGGARVGESLVDATPSSNGAHHVVVRFERETIRPSCWKRPRSRRSSRAGAHDAPLEQTNSSIVWLPEHRSSGWGPARSRVWAFCLALMNSGRAGAAGSENQLVRRFHDPIRGACVIALTRTIALRASSPGLRGADHIRRFLCGTPRYLTIL